MTGFCPACGAPLTRQNAVFCANCGHSLEQFPGSAPPSATRALSGPHLDIRWPGGQPYSVPLTAGRITLGRRRDNDVVVDYPTVSGHHALLQREGSDYRITDAGSSNGLQINGIAAQSALLKNGDVVRIPDGAGNWVTLTYLEDVEKGLPSGSTNLGHVSWATLPSPAFIGRDPQAQIPLASPAISWRHARLDQSGGGHQIQDLNSTNGTFVNGQRLRGGSHLLRPSDVIQIGPFKLVYEQAGLQQFSSQGQFRIDAVNLLQAVTIGRGGLLGRLRGLVGTGTSRASGNGRSAVPAATTKVIVNNVSLSIHPREFVAFVGGSGAGKSTLMNALNGVWPAKGQVLINGDDFYRNFDAYRSMLGYVPQDDIIHRGLPVKAALSYAAQLRFPNEPRDRLEQRIAEVLASLDLSKQANQMVNSLSGGQRKRVSIASELLAEPGLFFLDEPTSGLDPGLEGKMMSDLRGLADRGHTIVMVTHATANIAQCDLVTFMAEGRLAYFGPPNEAPSFFSAQGFPHIYNRLREDVEPPARPPADLQPYYQQVKAANPSAPVSASQLWEAKFRDSAVYQQFVSGRLRAAQSRSVSGVKAPTGPVKPSSRGARAPVWGQFSVLARRYLHLIFKDARSLFILLAVMPFIGLLLISIADQKDLLGETADAVVRIVETEGSYTVVAAAQKLLLMLALAVSLLGIFSGAYEIAKERAVYRRERMINLKLLPYLLSKVVVLFGFALVQAAALLLVVSLKVDMPPKGDILPPVVELYITLVLSALAGITLGLLVSALVSSQDMIIYVILLLLFVQIIFSGALFDVPEALSDITITRWSLEAMGSTVNMDRLDRMGIKEIAPDELDLPVTPSEPVQVDVRMDFNVDYLHDAAHLMVRWFILAAFALLFMGGTLWVLKRQDVI